MLHVGLIFVQWKMLSVCIYNQWWAPLLSQDKHPVECDATLSCSVFEIKEKNIGDAAPFQSLHVIRSLLHRSGDTHP